MLHKHHSVGARQVETQTADMGGEQQHVDGGVVVEPEQQRRQGWSKAGGLPVPDAGKRPHLDTMEWRRPAGTLPSSLR